MSTKSAFESRLLRCLFAFCTCLVFAPHRERKVSCFCDTLPSLPYFHLRPQTCALDVELPSIHSPIDILRRVSGLCVVYFSVHTAAIVLSAASTAASKTGLVSFQGPFGSSGFNPPNVFSIIRCGTLTRLLRKEYTRCFFMFVIKQRLSVVCRYPGGMDIHGQRSSNREFCAADPCRCWT